MMKGRNGVGKREALAVLALALLIYLLLNALRLKGLMAYLLPSACWGLLALAALRACGWDRVRSWFSSHVSMAAASVAICYVMLLLYVGVLSGFGRSPYSFAPPALVLNATMVVATLLGTEFSRACVVRGLGGKRPFLALSSVALLYSLLGISASRFIGLADPLAFTKFLGAALLPAVAESLLATYLALVGGPLASLSYRAPLAAFWWFSPILPHLPWGIEALLGVMVPSLGFFAINLYVHPMALRRLGLSAEPRGFGRPRESARGLIVLSIACVLLVWASTGLLGVQPTAILSGSMRPSMDVGDMAIVRQVPADSIKPGDIIQFWNGSEMVIHRVVEVYRGGNGRLFVTKGDANNEPDPLPVQPEQVRGKVIFTLPKVGWAAIAVKEFAARTWSFVSAYPLPTALVAVGFCAIYALRGRSSRRWRASGFKVRGGRRLALPLSLLLVATAASGLAYSHWSESLFIEGTVTTGAWGAQIGSYKIRVPHGICVEDWLSPDNRTLRLTCDNVLESWYCWVGLVIPNDGSAPIDVLEPVVEFSPEGAADDIQVEMYFYGPFSRGDFTDVYAHVKLPPLGPNDIAPPPPGDVPPPITLDPSQKAVIWMKLESTADLGGLQVYITVRGTTT